MGRIRNSSLGIGLGSSPQESIVQSEFDNKVNELFLNEYEPFDSTKLDYFESKEKYDSYLFDFNHKLGCSKAKFLKEVLGYTKGDGQKLHNAIKKATEEKIPNKIVKTDYGIKYNFDVTLEGKDGNLHSANVTIVVQNDDGKKTWRLITLIPREKD